MNTIILYLFLDLIIHRVSTMCSRPFNCRFVKVNVYICVFYHRSKTRERSLDRNALFTVDLLACTTITSKANSLNSDIIMRKR